MKRTHAINNSKSKLLTKCNIYLSYKGADIPCSLIVSTSPIKCDKKKKHQEKLVVPAFEKSIGNRTREM